MNLEKEKRLLLAAALAMGFLYVWSTFVVKKPVPAAAPAVQNASPLNSPQTNPVVASTPIPTTPAAITPAKAPLVGELFETQNKEMAIRWSTLGGAPVSVQLNDYKTTLEKNAALVRVFPFASSDKAPWSLSMNIDGKLVSDQEIIFEKSISQSDKSHSVRFLGFLDQGLKVEKIFTMDAAKPFDMNVKVSFVNIGATPRTVQGEWVLFGTLPPKPPGGFTQTAKRMFGSRDANEIKVATVVGDKLTHSNPLESFRKPDVGFAEWVGFDSQYFLSAMIPAVGNFETFHTEISSQSEAMIKAKYAPWIVQPNSTVDVSLDLFVGPKKGEILKMTKPILEKAIDLGDWLGVIARPIQALLKGIYKFIPNYGLAIILLTIIVRLMLWPLSLKQINSMKKMQEHKPYLDSLKEKFGEDKEGYSREMINYMRTNKINPMGGCLLLLPQLPVFFSLYRVIFNTVELRHAPFVGWINDLSAHDPYFVLPVLLGVAMYYQQKLTPSPSSDPAQQTVMKIMPVMFTSFMLFLPAGLNVYILVSTVWGICQQLWAQRQMPPQILTEKKVSYS